MTRNPRIAVSLNDWAYKRVCRIAKEWKVLKAYVISFYSLLALWHSEEQKKKNLIPREEKS